MSHSEQRLYRSTDEGKIGGVAAGIAEYFGISVTVIRILFIGTIFFGFGLPLYLLFWLLTPRDPAEGYAKRDFSGIFFYVVAALAILVGAALATRQELTVLPFLCGLAVGMFFLFRSKRTGLAEAQAHRGRIFTERADGDVDVYEAKIAGVCSRIASATGIDPVIVRVVSVILIPITFPLVPILYAVAALVLPKSSGAVSRR